MFRLPVRLFSTSINQKSVAKLKEVALISSKRKGFSCSTSILPPNQENAKKVKFGDIPLASQGWLSRRSKDDFFIVHPIHDEENVFNRSLSVDELPRLGIDNEIAINVKKNFDIEKLTTLQEKAIPQILNLNHVLIAAETGCGKTLTYLIPMITEILKRISVKRDFNSPLAVIITPGRELAEQIGNVCRKLSGDIKVKTLLGGSMKRIMLNPEFEEFDLLVASMGAISKMTTTGIYKMDHVRHVVLDEADTLLDDSFSNKLCYFLRHFPVSFLLNVHNIQNNKIHISFTEITSKQTVLLEHN